ncbi:aldo/keto reductase [Microbacterium suaedae]|uniref:aldo/keto reductase n=1 Tax=Microbacterium suaedae TaxID=2067813 RepID=UPI000DA24712|nr:aldo/keto reductase [Microbacterium suaedae]
MTMNSGRGVLVSGVRLPALGLGSWNTWDRMASDDAVALIRRAVDSGAGLFDVAHYDMGPHAEGSQTDRIFGRAFRASGVRRDEVFVCGKLWLWDWPETDARAQVLDSLRRAGLDHFDAIVVGDYREHVDPAAVCDAVNDLVDEGLVGRWGVNNWVVGDTLAAIERARRAGRVPPTFAQLKYSIARRSMAEGEPYGELFRSGVLALQASDVLEGGVLAGRLSPERKIGADVGGIRSEIAAAHGAIARIADGFGVTAAQLAIAFCVTHPATANVLLGVSRMTQLEEALAAVQLGNERGREIRDAVAQFWLDRGVAADGSW